MCLFPTLVGTFAYTAFFSDCESLKNDCSQSHETKSAFKKAQMYDSTKEE